MFNLLSNDDWLGQDVADLAYLFCLAEEALNRCEALGEEQAPRTCDNAFENVSSTVFFF
jgi:hypothetical protein